MAPRGTTNYTTFSGSASGVDIYLCPDDSADDIIPGFCLTPGPIDTKVIITDPDTVLVDLGTGTKVVGND